MTRSLKRCLPSRFHRLMVRMESIERRLASNIDLLHLNLGVLFLLAWLSAACSRATPTAPPPPPPPAVEYFAAWGTHGNGPGQLDVPVAMAVDNDSNLLIADAGSGYIQKFFLNGEPRLSFQDDRWNVHPTDVAVDGGGAIYVADGRRGSILIYWPDGSYYNELRTGVPPAARSSMRIAVDSHGALYVAAKQPFGIRRFTSGLRLDGTWGGGSGGDMKLENPVALGVGTDGSVYVGEAEHPEIKVFGTAGGFERTLSIPSGAADTRFSGIATNAKFVFAVDARCPVVYAWTLDGAYRLREDLSSWISGGVEAQRKMVIAPSEELLILDPLGWRVLRFHLHL